MLQHHQTVSLLHHFGSKEKLYREVLGRIAGQLLGSYNRPRRRWISRKPNWLLYWKDWTQVSGKWSRGLRVIMRELLDIGERGGQPRAPGP